MSSRKALPLHRAVPPIRPRDLHRIFGMVAPDQQGRVDPFPAPAPTDFDTWAETFQREQYRPTLADRYFRIVGLFAENALPAGLGFVTGLMLTVGLAWVWSWFL